MHTGSRHQGWKPQKWTGKGPAHSPAAVTIRWEKQKTNRPHKQTSNMESDSGVVPGLSGADWSGFPAPPSLPPFFPPALSLPCLDCSFWTLAQCGTSGRRLVRVSLRWSLIPTLPPFLTKHCLWPQTGPGLLLLMSIRAKLMAGASSV